MRVTFDSNAWETIYAAGDTAGAPIRAAFDDRRLAGFICDAGFRIEAVTKRDRGIYFAQPYMETRIEPPIPKGNGRFKIAMSIGPDNGKHPGLPVAQAEKLRRALAAGIKLISGNNWMGLPNPPELNDRTSYVPEDVEARTAREGRQLEIFAEISARGVGKAAFDAADGWTVRPRTQDEDKSLIKACAEWADAELVAAHFAYQHDILCTNDRGRSSGRSVLDVTNRSWLFTRHRVTCLTLDELTAKVAP